MIELSPVKSVDHEWSKNSTVLESKTPLIKNVKKWTPYLEESLETSPTVKSSRNFRKHV